jgi:hypothetical protein
VKGDQSIFHQWHPHNTVFASSHPGKALLPVLYPHYTIGIPILTQCQTFLVSLGVTWKKKTYLFDLEPV